MSKISKRVASQPMTIIRGPRCALYQPARRLIQDPRIRVAGERASQGAGSWSTTERMRTYQECAALVLHLQCSGTGQIRPRTEQVRRKIRVPLLGVLSGIRHQVRVWISRFHWSSSGMNPMDKPNGTSSLASGRISSPSWMRLTRHVPCKPASLSRSSVLTPIGSSAPFRGCAAVGGTEPASMPANAPLAKDST